MNNFTKQFSTILFIEAIKNVKLEVVNYVYIAKIILLVFSKNLKKIRNYVRWQIMTGLQLF